MPRHTTQSRPMRLASRFNLSVGGLLVIALASATLTVWTVKRTTFYLDRVNFAHQ